MHLPGWVTVQVYMTEENTWINCSGTILRHLTRCFPTTYIRTQTCKHELSIVAAINSTTTTTAVMHRPLRARVLLRQPLPSHPIKLHPAGVYAVDRSATIRAARKNAADHASAAGVAKSSGWRKPSAVHATVTVVTQSTRAANCCAATSRVWHGHVASTAAAAAVAKNG